MYQGHGWIICWLCDIYGWIICWLCDIIYGRIICWLCDIIYGRIICWLCDIIHGWIICWLCDIIYGWIICVMSEIDCCFVVGAIVTLCADLTSTHTMILLYINSFLRMFIKPEFVNSRKHVRWDILLCFPRESLAWKMCTCSSHGI